MKSYIDVATTFGKAWLFSFGSVPTGKDIITLVSSTLGQLGFQFARCIEEEYRASNQCPKISKRAS